jgi:imidazolonepropionase-like amidohydrolase
MTEIGMSGEQALAAGSWAAREWLGVPGELTPGAPADLVVYDEDPRQDPRVLDRPRLIVLRGRVVKG